MSRPTPPEQTEQILHLFERAAGLNSGQRAAYLDEACADNLNLRREVEALLDAYSQTGITDELDEALKASLVSWSKAFEIQEGQRVVHYQVVGKLGAGGMGLVFKARDTRLDRFVALKFLPPHLSLNEEAKQRFIREAKAASALDHTNICTIYEIGETRDGQLFMAMACYEGETLKEKVVRGPLPVDEAVGYAMQVAAGLSQAHQAGIVHRDVKPANVMVTEQGEVKILDFGVAKGGEQTQLTRTGAIIGTVAYMSPEQLRGEDVDRRTDIWSLGVVLHEMITGQRPFKGDYDRMVMHSILYEEPEPPTGLKAGEPLVWGEVVAKCLAKKPSDRYQQVDAVLTDLQAIDRTATRTTRPAAPPITPAAVRKQPRHARQAVPWRIVALVLIAALLVGSLAVWTATRPQSSALSPVKQFVMPLDGLGQFGTPAFSPDGTALVFSAADSTGSKLYLRRMDALEALPLPGTEGGKGQVFFSPDGRWAGFVANQVLKKVLIEGSSPVPVIDSVFIPFATWGPDDTVIFTGPGYRGGLAQVSATGGTPRPLTTLDTLQAEALHHFPEMLPDGKSVLFSIVYADDNRSIAVLDLETGQRKVVLDEGYFPRYAPTGHLLYSASDNDGVMMAAPFDLTRLAVTDTPVPVLAGAMSLSVAFSSDGSLVYRPQRDAESAYSLAWVDRQGGETVLMEEWRPYRIPPRVSPDGKQVAVSLEADDGAVHIWIHNAETGAFNPLTYVGRNFFPNWTPDGERVTFLSIREGSSTLYWKRADGSGEAEPLVPEDVTMGKSSWSKEDSLLAFDDFHPETRSDLWIFSPKEARTWPLLRESANERSPRFAPLGYWIAYVSDETGEDEVYVTGLDPDRDGKRRISNGGGHTPVWASDSKTLYYRNGAQVLAIAVELQPTFLVRGTPQVVFENQSLRSFDIHPDGDRFLIAKRSEGAVPEAQAIVVLNWFDELNRLVPRGK